MNNKEKSAIDAIYEILDKLEEFNNKLTLIDNNIKLLNNKVNKLNSDQVSKRGPSTQQATVPRAVVPSASSKPHIDEKEERTVKVFGRIKNKTKKPIKGIDVKIYNRVGENFKTRTTDKNGYWEARIPLGEYGIEYDPANISKRLKPVNFKVIVDGKLDELDVSEINKL